MSAITSELARLSGPLAYLVVAALVFGETALFFGFVLPGEIAVVLGGVLASRGRVSCRCSSWSWWPPRSSARWWATR